MRRRAFVAVLVVALTREASGDIYHLKSPSKVETEKGSKLSLPPGYFLDEATWAARDAELKAAQADRTRLKAENDSLRKSTSEGGGAWLAGTAVLSIVAGVVYSLAK